MKKCRAQATPEKKQQEINEAKIRMSTIRAQATPEKKEQEKLAHKASMANLRKTKQAKENAIFDSIKCLNKTDPSILNTDAFHTVKQKFNEAVSEGPEYDCDICWQMCFKRSIRQLKPENYEKDEQQTELFNKCRQNVSEWICNSCHAKLKRSEMPATAIANGLNLCPSVEELDCLNGIEHALICQVLPFMSIVARHRGAQSGLKGQVVLVPTDLTKLQRVLPRSSNDEHIISVALKRRLTDNSAYIKQNISPARINAALLWLKNNNPLYSHIQIDDNWERTMQESDPELWSMLTEEIPIDEQSPVIDHETLKVMTIMKKNRFISQAYHIHRLFVMFMGQMCL